MRTASGFELVPLKEFLRKADRSPVKVNQTVFVIKNENASSILGRACSVTRISGQIYVVKNYDEIADCRAQIVDRGLKRARLAAQAWLDPQ